MMESRRKTKETETFKLDPKPILAEQRLIATPDRKLTSDRKNTRQRHPKGITTYASSSQSDSDILCTGMLNCDRRRGLVAVRIEPNE